MASSSTQTAAREPSWADVSASRLILTGPGFNGDSRRLRLAKGEKMVEGIASKLSLRTLIVDAGKRYYRLAFEKNFIQGRNTNEIAGVCLYIACRREKTPHLLIDFSDVL